MITSIRSYVLYAKVAGVTKVLCADNAAYGHQLAENIAPLVVWLGALLIIPHIDLFITSLQVKDTLYRTFELLKQILMND